MHKYFYDWEFEENGETIIPISLGMVDDQDRELYIINRDYIDNVQSGKHQPIKWLYDNVLNHISEYDYLNYSEPLADFGSIIQNFISQDNRITDREQVELWADYCAYDHVCLAQRFGPMIKLPEPIPMFTNDLRQTINQSRYTPTFKPERAHHALYDAKWAKKVHDLLR